MMRRLAAFWEGGGGGPDERARHVDTTAFGDRAFDARTFVARQRHRQHRRVLDGLHRAADGAGDVVGTDRSEQIGTFVLAVLEAVQRTGRIGMKAEHEKGSEGIELRTLVGRRNEAGLLGIEVGPRIERRLRRGMMFFIDGKAEARALRGQDTGWWALPGTSAADGMVGVTARTGLVR